MPSVRVNELIVTDWPDAIDVLSSVRSPPPPVAVTVPWIWQVEPPESLTRKCPAVPVAFALASCQVPDFALLPLAAAAIQSEGSVIDARSVPESAVAQSAGAAPDRISRIADVPIVDSI